MSTYDFLIDLSCHLLEETMVERALVPEFELLVQAHDQPSSQLQLTDGDGYENVHVYVEHIKWIELASLQTQTD